MCRRVCLRLFHALNFICAEIMQHIFGIHRYSVGKRQLYRWVNENVHMSRCILRAYTYINLWIHNVTKFTKSYTINLCSHRVSCLDIFGFDDDGLLFIGFAKIERHISVPFQIPLLLVSFLDFILANISVFSTPMKCRLMAILGTKLTQDLP